MIQIPPPVGEQTRAKDSDFILEIEGPPYLKCEQAFKRPNDEARQGSHEGIPEAQCGNGHADDGSVVRRYSNPGETGGSHGGVARETSNPNSE